MNNAHQRDRLFCHLELRCEVPRNKNVQYQMLWFTTILTLLHLLCFSISGRSRGQRRLRGEFWLGGMDSTMRIINWRSAHKFSCAFAPQNGTPRRPGWHSCRMSDQMARKKVSRTTIAFSLHASSWITNISIQEWKIRGNRNEWWVGRTAEKQTNYLTESVTLVVKRR